MAATASIDNIIGAELGQYQQEKTAAASAQKSLADISQKEISQYSDFHKQFTDLQAKAPKLPDIKPFQAPQQQNPMSMFGSAAGILATLASFATKTPLTASLNSMTQAMKAIREGNADAYDKAFKEYQTNTDYALKMNDLENKQYEQSIDMLKTDYDAGMAALQNQAHMTQDKAMLAALPDPSKAGELLIARQRLGIEAMRYKAMVDRQGQAKNKQLQTASALDGAISRIDNTIAAIKESPIGVTGVSGTINKYWESAQNQAREFTGQQGVPQPARDIDNQFDLIKADARNLLLHSKYMSAGAIDTLNDIVRGEGDYDTRADALGSLQRMRDAYIQAKQGVLNEPEDTFNDSGATYTEGETITGPDGKKYRVTGGDPSDPDIEPIK